MFKKLREWLTLAERFEKLQKAHDLRMVLNTRLSAENVRLKREIKALAGPRKISGAQKQIDNLSAARATDKALHHLRLTRHEVLLKKMTLVLPLSVVQVLQREVEEMTDEEVMAWRRPKPQEKACTTL